MRRSSRWLVAGAVCAALGSSGLAASSLAEVKERGKLIVLAFDHPESGFLRRDSAGGIVGFDVDLLRSFARLQEVSLDFRLYDSFPKLIPALLAGEGDLIGGSLTITPERRRVVRFSDPYFPVAVGVVVRAGSSLRSMEDLPGAVGVTVPGSSIAEWMAEVDGAEVRHVAIIDEMFVSLARGDGDFAFVDSASALQGVSDHPGLEVGFWLPKADQYAFAFAPDSDIVEAMDAYLGSLRHHAALYRLVLKHFGDRGVELFKLAESLAPED